MGGLFLSSESRPTPRIQSRYSLACSRVSAADSADMSRRKHMIRCERMPWRCWASAWARRSPVITVPNSMPRVV